MMFDPLLINAAASTSGETRQLPDHDLVTSLNEQVTEIADRLSSIMTNDVEVEHREKHSFSTNDVSTIITDTEPYGFSGPRNEQLSCMPSTSHGYLIPNAISQEPVVLSLSHNNSAVFNQEDESHEVNGAILNSDLPLMIPDNIDTDIVNTNIEIANANLSSILLTNREFRQNFMNETGDDNTSFHSAKTTLDREEDERVKFMLGYESDHESPVDSGVSTENTSLDRSPDSDQSKDIKESFMQQNRVLETPDEKDTKNKLESSFSDVNVDSVNINYVEEGSDTQKNEGGSSGIVISRLSEEEGLGEATNSKLQDWRANAPDEEFRSIDEVITDLRRQRESDRKISTLVEDNNVSEATQSTSRQKKRKSSAKSKRKKSSMWSPGMVILDNRSTQAQNPLRLNLDHFVDER